MKDSCRNCGSADIKDLGFIGEVAPFFLKRVLNVEIGTRVSADSRKRLVQRLLASPNSIFQRIHRPGAFMEMEICLRCKFVQTKYPFTDQDLGRLYSDYRTESYDRERIRYEPGYAEIANDVGRADQEIDCRVGGLTTWLQGKIEAASDFSMLDFGGSDGRFLPRLPGSKFVFEISNTTPLPGFVKISDESKLGTYSYVQIAHVLEHVSEPLALLSHVAKFMKSSGYLYIEVPQDLPDADLAKLTNGSIGRTLMIHEHINMYCTSSVRQLVEAAGLTPIHVESFPIDLGWIRGTNIRALCTRPR
jgi:hypothetical protein